MLRTLEPAGSHVCMIMDRAREGDETRRLMLELGFTPKLNRLNPWGYNKSCTVVVAKGSACFGDSKGSRRIFSGFDKLDVMFAAVIHFASIAEALR
jgi:hypothetical protein